MSTLLMWFRGHDQPIKVEVPNLDVVTAFETFLKDGEPKAAGCYTVTQGALVVKLEEVEVMVYGAVPGRATHASDLRLQGRQDAVLVPAKDESDVQDALLKYLTGKRQNKAYVFRVRDVFMSVVDLSRVVSAQSEPVGKQQ